MIMAKFPEMARSGQFLRRMRLFRRDETGSVAIEGVFGSVLLIAWLLVSFQVYDAFKLRSAATRATFTVADMLSRTREEIGPKYVAGMEKVFAFLTRANKPNQTWLRVTLFKCKAEPDDDSSVTYCDGKNKKFTLDTGKDGKIASYVYPPSAAQPYTQAGLNAEADRIPIMAIGDMAVLTETVYHFNPFLDIGDRGLSFDNGKTWTQIGLKTGLPFSTFVVTRPREPRIVWNADK
ncbi:hypothetical protein FGG78_08695 [Thioclava sp. BHET1]|uniref:Pilus assembly protein n=1 Tax=Thioclava dalianensis TaxID=1185766 RepID=A0A074TII9_9RHOB|nr:hypothetical protein [Thioclava dalianensis]KEP71464.1 hypothetical protein DL1_07590 [Thioclava dalianensis]TMV92072.1 hypothetical protein FGG78_08695 [Thioclava sp. BHET1]SFM80006.1 hypothetical protein SAMN05216224_101365 [Thioclava dalianensis]